MAIIVRINCDRGNAHGTCPSASWPAHTIEDAISMAESQGWYIKPDRHLCDRCSGNKTQR